MSKAEKMKDRLEKYIKRIENKIERYRDALTDSFKTDPSGDTYEFLVPVANELHKVKRNLDIVMNGVLLTPLNGIGDLFTLDKFKSMVEEGGVSDYDGHGYYSDGENETNMMVDLDDIVDDYNHVVWYNR